ncbi:DUF5317 domain-containing protein [Meiothermus sp. CFH 77666]|nr:DUF5317 domain-containing protein [Meiothermus sp. CFH 77666]
MVLALAFRASFRDLAHIELRAAWAFVGAALLEGGLAFATSRGLIAPEIAGPTAKTLVLLLVGYGLWANAHLRGLWFVGLGLACNALVIFANKGHMPVSAEALYKVGMESFIPKLQQQYDAVHTLISESSRLWFLADVIPVRILGYTNVISLGDVYLMVGIALTVLEGALKAKRKAQATFDIDLRF